MAQEMKYSNWDHWGRKKIGAEVKYPWDQWLNGSMWYLIQGEDFEVDTLAFQKYLHNYATQHGIKVKTKRARNHRDLFIKAIRNNSRTGIARRQHFDALEERRLKIKYGWDWREHLEYEQTEGAERPTEKRRSVGKRPRVDSPGSGGERGAEETEGTEG